MNAGKTPAGSTPTLAHEARSCSPRSSRTPSAPWSTRPARRGRRAARARGAAASRTAASSVRQSPWTSSTSLRPAAREHAARSGRRRASYGALRDDERPAGSARSSRRDASGQREVEARRRRGRAAGRARRARTCRRASPSRARRCRARGRRGRSRSASNFRARLAIERQRVARPADEEHAQPASAGPATRAASPRARRRRGRARTRRRRARRPRAAARASSSSAKKRRIAPPSALGVPGLDEQAVSSSRHHLGDAAGARREHGRSDRERLDDRVREVLPRRGEDRGVGGAEELEHAVAGLRRRGSARGRRSPARPRDARAARGPAPRRRSAARRRRRARPPRRRARATSARSAGRRTRAWRR